MAATKAFLKENVLKYDSRPKTGVVKVLRHLKGPVEDGSVMKEVADSKMYINAVFTRDSLEAFVNSYEDSFNDGSPEWDHALLLLNQHQVLFQHSTHPGNEEGRPRFVLLVERFTLMDLNEGFYSKQQVYELMGDPEVRRKAAELEMLHNQRASQDGGAAGDSECLTQLLEQMGVSSMSLATETESQSQQLPTHEWCADYNPPAEDSTSDGQRTTTTHGSTSGMDDDTSQSHDKNSSDSLTAGPTLRTGGWTSRLQQNGLGGDGGGDDGENSRGVGLQEETNLACDAGHSSSSATDQHNTHNEESSSAKGVSGPPPVQCEQHVLGSSQRQRCDESQQENTEAAQQNSSGESIHHHPSVSFTCSSPDDLDSMDTSTKFEDWQHQVPTDIGNSNTPVTQPGKTITPDISPDTTLPATQTFHVFSSQGFSPTDMLSQNLLPDLEACREADDAEGMQDQVTSTFTDGATGSGKTKPVGRDFQVVQDKRSGISHACVGSDRFFERESGVDESKETNTLTGESDGKGGSGDSVDDLPFDESVEMTSPDCCVLQSTQKHSDGQDLQQFTQCLSPIEKDATVHSKKRMVAAADLEEEERIRHLGTRAKQSHPQNATSGASDVGDSGASGQSRWTLELSSSTSQGREGEVSLGRVLVCDSGSDGEEVAVTGNVNEQCVTTDGRHGPSGSVTSVSPDVLVSDTSWDSVVLVPSNSGSGSDSIKDEDTTTQAGQCQASQEVVVVLSSGDDSGAVQCDEVDEMNDCGNEGAREMHGGESRWTSVPVTGHRTAPKSAEKQCDTLYPVRLEVQSEKQQQSNVRSRKRLLPLDNLWSENAESGSNSPHRGNAGDGGNINNASKRQRCTRTTTSAEERDASSSVHLQDDTSTDRAMRRTFHLSLAGETGAEDRCKKTGRETGAEDRCKKTGRETEMPDPDTVLSESTSKSTSLSESHVQETEREGGYSDDGLADGHGGKSASETDKEKSTTSNGCPPSVDAAATITVHSKASPTPSTSSAASHGVEINVEGDILFGGCKFKRVKRLNSKRSVAAAVKFILSGDRTSAEPVHSMRSQEHRGRKSQDPPVDEMQRSSERRSNTLVCNTPPRSVASKTPRKAISSKTPQKVASPRVRHSSRKAAGSSDKCSPATASERKQPDRDRSLQQTAPSPPSHTTNTEKRSQVPAFSSCGSGGGNSQDKGRVFVRETGRSQDKGRGFVRETGRSHQDKGRGVVRETGRSHQNPSHGAVTHRSSISVGPQGTENSDGQADVESCSLLLPSETAVHRRFSLFKLTNSLMEQVDEIVQESVN
ncbi:hypothetical protein BaRGS_00027038 [Batillaria attramentaria]|uniref:Telomere replication protein EST3 n=1 Tax=Batillaria attramentaria TaxID=370345 RepID=A0ABD0K431_9CAEN